MYTFSKGTVATSERKKKQTKKNIVKSIKIRHMLFSGGSSLSQLRVSVPVDLAILFGQILVDLILLDLRS